MGAFDQALTPTAVTPSTTADTTLDPGQTDDCSVLVDVANITGTDNVSVRVGIAPSGGSVHWKLFDVPIPANDSILALGPWFLQVGDVVTVRTSDADEITFSLTGVESS